MIFLLVSGFMTSKKTVAPAVGASPIRSAPLDYLFAGPFIGLTLVNLCIDQSKPSIQQAFFTAVVLEAPRWFFWYKIIFAILGGLKHLTNFIFVFTRQSSIKRKILDSIVFLAFYSNMYVTITKAVPLEVACAKNGTISSNLFYFHLYALIAR